MTEHENVFQNSQDAYDLLQKKYDTLVIEYNLLYDSLQIHLSDDKDRKIYLIDKYSKDNNNITSKIIAIKQAKVRAIG